MESTRFVAPQGKSQKLRETRGIPMPSGRPGMLAALHLQDLRVSDCTWEIRNPTETATQSESIRHIKPLQSSNLWVTKLQRPGNAVEHSALARVYALDTIALPIARTDIVSLQKARKMKS